MIQSFWQLYARPAYNPIPEKVILNTAFEVKPLFDLLDYSVICGWGREEAVALILSWITYEDKAEMELSYGAAELVINFVNTDLEEDASNIANWMVHFGMFLRDELRAMQAYRNGYLLYNFCGWCGNDVILARLAPEHIPELH